MSQNIESSVQSPYYLKISSQQSSSASRYQMRDLYNRPKRLADWIKRVNENVDEPDRTDILKLVEHMQNEERAILWIVRCIMALITIRKHLEKPFRNVTKDDMRSILKWMEQKGYKASTNEKFRQVLKLFYKVIYGNNEYYPEQVPSSYSLILFFSSYMQLAIIWCVSVGTLVLLIYG
jgi:hypothetical protein